MLPRCIYVIILETYRATLGKPNLWGEPGALAFKTLNTIFFYLDTNLNFRLYIIQRRHERVCLCVRVSVCAYANECRRLLVRELSSKAYTAYRSATEIVLEQRVVSHFPDDQLTSNCQRVGPWWR